MDQSYYKVNTLWNGHRFEYLSIGSSIIRKAIVFYELEVPFLYSMMLGDMGEDNVLSTDSRSNNGDMVKILATVYRTMEQFLNKNPRAIIAFQGNTAAKNRLYRMAITKNLIQFQERYLVWGVRSDNGRRELFEVNQPYKTFFAANKIL